MAKTSSTISAAERKGKDRTSVSVGIDLNEGDSKRIDDLEKEVERISVLANSVKASIESTEARIDSTSSFLSWVAGGIIIAFFLMAVPIFFSYFKDRSDQFRDYQNQLSPLIVETMRVSRELKDLKDCLRSGKYSVCLF